MGKLLVRAPWQRVAWLGLVVLFAALLATACADDDDGEDGAETPGAGGTPAATGSPAASAQGEALRIAFLGDYTGALAEFGPAIETGARLAVKHINEAGGVNGQPVQLLTGDDQTNETAAVEEARRLIEIEGVSAIVGPLASGVTIAVAESVAAPAQVVVISPSATSPGLTDARDDDFLFRSTTSDAAQGVILADLAEQEGIESVGVVYLNNAYGEGLARVFEESFGAENVSMAAIGDAQTTYLSELQQAKSGEAEVLVAIGYPEQAGIFVREAIENGLFERFLFVDGTKSEDLITEIGAEALDGMKGTAPTGGPETDALRAWNEAYEAEYGQLPTLPFIREAYDAVIAIALAAEKAGSNAGPDIRDALRDVAGPEGEVFIPGAEGVAGALEAIRNGTDINFEGAATTLDWDENGDVVTGYIGIWQYQEGVIVEIDTVPFNLAE